MASAEFVSAWVCGGSLINGVHFGQYYSREGPSLSDFVDWLTPLCFYVPPHPHNKAQAASSPTELLGITLATSSC